MNSLEEIALELGKRDQYILVGHAIPDGDCIGSLIALYLGLCSLGKAVKVLVQDPVPEIYRYLSGSGVFLQPGELHIGYENIIYLDCSDLERVGDKTAALLEKSKFSFNIDHHKSNDIFADLNYVDIHAAATAEIVFQLLMLLNITISADMAKAIYAGIVQDTGGFCHSSTSSRTFRIAADLLDLGVNLEQTKTNLFESKNKIEILLLAKALQHIEFSKDGKIAWMTLSFNDVTSIGAADIHPEGIINHTLMTKGVEIGLLFREISPGVVKIGFRSKGQYDVSDIAAKFGGGGHRQAAGATRDGNISDISKQVIAVIRDVIR